MMLMFIIGGCVGCLATYFVLSLPTYTKDTSELERTIMCAMDAMHEHLNGGGSVYGERDAATKKWTLYVTCTTCRKRNRMHKGIADANCGQCHTPFNRPTKTGKKTMEMVN